MAQHRIRLTTLAAAVCLATAGLSPLLIAGPANASEQANAYVTGNGGHLYTLYYFGQDGHDSHLALTLAETADHSAFIYTIDDDVTITAGQNCTYPQASDHTKVSCIIENFVDESLAVDPNAGVNLGSGNDTVTFSNLSGAKFSNSIGLGDGDNTYTTTTTSGYGGAFVYSGSGADTYMLGTGDFIGSGAGNDTITVAGGAAEVHAGAGNDLITGGTGDDKLYGGTGDDTIYGNDGNDYLVGEQGNDTLYGGRGNDTIYGNSGDDVMYGNSGDDWLSGGPGTDTISGGTGTNTILN
jgi:Ca2+-binding RTX toxin-like protein